MTGANARDGDTFGDIQMRKKGSANDAKNEDNANNVVLQHEEPTL